MVKQWGNRLFLNVRRAKVNRLLGLFVFTIALSSCVYPPTSSIIEINSFDQVNFEKITKNELVIFDVDETLVQPTDAFLINEHTTQAEEFRKKLLKRYPEVTSQEWENIATIMLIDSERPLLEPSVIEKINGLKKRGIPVIACTAMNTGSFGTLASMEDWRYNHLKALGFEGSFADDIVKFTSFARKPVFYKGILATDLESKGLVIGAFIDTKRLHPKGIVMFDDTLEFLQLVKDECKKRGIAFQGYHYKGAYEKPWNEELFEKQAEYLIKNKKWLGDV